LEEGTSCGQPSFKANGKVLTRIRAEHGSAVFTEVVFDERETPMGADPATFHITDPYKAYPAPLARLMGLDEATARSFIERRWRGITPNRAMKLYTDSGTKCADRRGAPFGSARTVSGALRPAERAPIAGGPDRRRRRSRRA
jgi:hypothetical protein